MMSANNSDIKRMEIMQDKGAQLLNVSITFVMAVLSFVMVFSEVESVIMEITFAFIGVVGILFFGIGFLFELKRLFDKRPALIINANGIVDNTRVSSFGFIPWEEMEEVKISFLFGHKYIIVRLRFYDCILDDITFAQRMTVEIHRLLGFPVVAIDLSATKYRDNYVEILNIFNKHIVKTVATRANTARPLRNM